MSLRSRRFLFVLFAATSLCLLFWQSARMQSPLRRITNTTDEGKSLSPTISGDGRIIAFESTEDIAHAGGAEGFRAIRANVSVDPATFLQMAAARGPAPAISQDGTRIAFAAKDNPLGTNNDFNSEIFLYDGAKLIQVTNTSPGDASNRAINGNFQPSISDDGRFIAFSSNRQLGGQNTDGNLEIFVYDAVALNFAQVTNSAGVVGSTDAKISGDGNELAYIHEGGATPGASRRLLLANRSGLTPVRVLATETPSLSLTYGRAISDDGSRVVWSAETAPDSTQVFLFDGRNNVTRQITLLGARSTEVPLHPSISGDGSRISFAARRTVMPGNSDNSIEVYTFDIPSGQLARVTSAPVAADGFDGSRREVEVVSSLNDDGSVIAFNFPRVISGAVPNPDFVNNSEIYVNGTTPRPTSGVVTVLNGASFGHEPATTEAVAPDSVAVAQGSALAFRSEQSQPQNGAFPTTVAGTTVTVNGRSAQIFFVSPNQVNFHVPAATELGTAEVVVTNSDGFQSRGTVAVLNGAPGVFTSSGDGLGEGVILNADTLTPGPFDPTSGNLRLIVFSTGVRNATTVTATAGGRALTVESVAENPNMPGMDEIHVLVPADLRGVGIVDLVVRADGRDSNPVTVEFIGDARRDVLINEFLADPAEGAAGDANRDGTRDASQDEFVELVNTTTNDIDLSGYRILTRGTGSDTVRHVFAAGTILRACSAVVVFGGGNTSFNPSDTAFGGSLVLKASSGGLSLVNSGGAITLQDQASTIVNLVSYGGSSGLEADNDQSVTRSPDITGNFAQHLAASGGARAFSPGTQLNGAPFNSCTPAIARVEVLPATATIDAAAQQQFTAKAFDAGNNEVPGVIFTWQSSNTAVATIDLNGLATGVSAGSTEIRATGRGVQSPPAVLTVNPFTPPNVVINEVDSDQVGTDTAEFVELYDGGAGNTSLTGLVVVLYNGSDDQSYEAFDLDGFATSANGYFTLGTAAVAGVDLQFPDGTMQNGADAVAIFVGNEADFPNGTPVTTTNLLDAVVYDTADADDPGLLALLNSGQPQVNEDTGGVGVNSNQRCPNGSGGARNTSTYNQFAPTPDGVNICMVVSTPPTLSIDDVSLNEGNTGPTTFTFTVSLSAPAPAGGVSFDITTVDNTATVADNDYVAKTLTAQTIAAGAQTYQFTVSVNGDTTIEPNESFFVNVSNLTGATIVDGQGLGTIQNDDSPVLSVTDVLASEGNAGTTTFTFTVTSTLPAPAGGITFDIATSDATAQDGNPGTEDTDYVAKSLTAQTIAAGNTTYTFDVTVNGDTSVEPNETFFVDVTNVSGASVSDGQGQGTIQNDDGAILVISQIYAGGGNAGAQFTNDFVEIFNRGTTTVNFASTPYSIQYAGATANFGSSKVDLTSGTMAPGQYFLVQLSSGGANGVPLPTPDATGTIAMAATAGKVALVAGTTALTGTGCPLSATVADFAGYGTTANCFEGPGPAPAPSNTTADFRKAGGCTDTNDNAADFLVAAPSPRNTSSPINDCTAADLSITKTDSPDPVTAGADVTYTITVTNNGPAAAASVVVNDTLTGTGNITTCSSTAGGVCSGTGNTRSITFASIASGGSATITIVANATGTGGTTITNTASVSSAAADPSPGNNSAQAVTTVQAPPPVVDHVDVSPTSATINRGNTQQFTATAFDALNQPIPGATFTWSSSNNDVATVDTNGLATGAGIGTVTISATTSDGLGGMISGTAMLTVQVPLVINEALPQVPLDSGGTTAIEGDSNRDGVRSADDDEFVELLNNSNAPVNISGVIIADSTSNRFTVPASTTLAPGRALIVFGGGSPPVSDPAFGGALIFTTSSLGLTDGGDTITIKLPVGAADVTIDSLAYGTGNPVAAPGPESLTRSPDAEVGSAGGSFVNHTTATNAAGRVFSPGTRADGTPFGSPAITRIEVLPTGAAINIAATQLFTAHAYSNVGGPEIEVFNVSFIWDSSDITKATVAPTTGQTTTATAIADGSTTIRARAGGQQGTATLTVNPPPPALTINNVSQAETNGGTTTFTFQVSLSTPAQAGGVTFDIATADGTAEDDNPATEDNDYVAQALIGQTIPAGNSTFNFAVTVNGDLVIEPDETFFVDVTNVVGATVSDGQGLGTILNDDSPSLTINDVSANETNSGTTTFTFTVTSSLPAPVGGITFDIATADGTAQDDNPPSEDNDYVANSLTSQTIAAGNTTYSFDVTVNGDLFVEASETFVVNLSNVSGASVSDGQGVGTIQNDDTANLVISQLYAGGGNAGAQFTNDFVEIFNRGTTTINFASTPYSIQYAGPTAAFSTNKTDLTSGILLPGQYFLVQEGSGGINGVALPTPDATGAIAMAATAGKVALVSGTTALTGSGCPLAATVADFVGYGTTANCFEGAAPAPAPSNTTADLRKAGGCTDTNDNAADFLVAAPAPRNTSSPFNNCIAGTPPNLTINDVTVVEGNAGTTTATFTVSLSAPAPSVDVTFDIATQNDTATTANSDYVAKTLTGQVIPAGQQTYTFTVNVNGDTAVENDETFFVNVTNVSGATVTDGQGVGTIQNDDLPSLSINDVSLNEGNSGPATFTFTVSLSTAAPTGGVTFDIATQDNSATVADNDYVANSLTSQVIAAGSSTYTFDVTVNGDLAIEPNETFFVNVTNVSGATVTDGQGQGTILNDDSPSLTINDVTQSEGNAGATIFTFTVTSSLPAPAGGITFDIATADGTAQDDTPATEDNDYVAQSLTAQTITAGNTTYTFNVTVNGDTLVETSETFFVNLTNVTNATVLDGQGLGTIQNDDTPLLVISQVYGGGGNASATYTNDFIEIFNRGTSTVDFSVTPYSVQYAGATAAFTTNKTDLTSGILLPGQYFLVQEGTGGIVGVALPTPDATGTIAMSATAGKVALVSGTIALTGTGCPPGATIVDFLGYGSTANCSETAPIPVSGTNSNARSVIRTVSCTDTNNNSVDFSNPTTAPVARNTATTPAPCP